MTMVSFLLVYLYGVHNTIGDDRVQDIHQILFIGQSVTREFREVSKKTLNSSFGENSVLGYLCPFSSILAAVPDPLGGKLKNIDYSHNKYLPLTNWASSRPI